jgi:lysophospholipase L1-like esterase
MKRVFPGLCFGLALVLTGVIPSQQAHATGFVGAKSYYLALGDSLAFGYQPNLTFSQGYADDFYANLKTHGTSHFTNMGCPDETSTTFMKGGCPYWYLRKSFYLGSQLSAALSFIKNHPGQVSPVTLDIGANDVLPDINKSDCSISSTWQTDLARFNTNFVSILKQHSSALNGKGDLLVMNYYDPYQNTCALLNPNVLTDLQLMNSDIAADTAGTAAVVVPVFDAFGGATTPNANICSYTWMCSSSNDIHPTATGYGVIAGAFESTSGY